MPLKDYVLELNKHINDTKSFLFGSRISHDRICVVMASAPQATYLVEQVSVIKVNDDKIYLKYYLAKAVRVIISNAVFGISNATLKKYLTKDCKIKTLSSLAEFKVNMGYKNNDIFGMKRYRRFVYIQTT